MTSLDPKRNFTDEERKYIYNKNKGCCQLRIKCNGEKVPWDDAHIDHIKPHSKRGRTVVSNGQVACSKCNLAKGDN